MFLENLKQFKYLTYKHIFSLSFYLSNNNTTNNNLSAINRFS